MRCDWWIAIHFVGFCVLFGQSVADLFMIDSSEKRKSLVGVEIQSPRSNE